jgi:hypothetical protein
MHICFPARTRSYCPRSTRLPVLPNAIGREGSSSGTLQAIRAIKVKVYFEDEYPHRTHRSNSPRQTTCRIEIENLGRISDEDDEEHNAIFEVKPIFNRTFRRETPSSRIIRPLVARNTRDVRALEFIKYWTTECQLHHKTCNNSIAAMVGHSSDCLPKRLISVNRNNRLRLVMPVKTRPPQDYRYATLTHKWEKGEGLRLSRKNMDKLHKSIMFTSLPPSFRDAVRVCRFLDIPYLWIDTLCIVQDDHRERAREICNMGHIYNNAYFEHRSHVSSTGRR